MDEHDQSLEGNSATEDKQLEDEDDGEEFEDDDGDDGDGDGDGQEDDDSDEQTQFSELTSSLTPIGDELGHSQSLTLSVPPLSQSPMDYTLEGHESAELKNQVRGSHQEALASVIAQAAQTRFHNQLQLRVCSSSSSDLSPTAVTHSISSIPSPSLHEQRLSQGKTVSASPIVKKPFSDGYNWRKYGQKQVKKPQGSRSYYRCTYTECYAKKIECCDHSTHVVETIYKGRHNHDPPGKVNCTRQSKHAVSGAAIVASNDTTHPIKTLMDSVHSTMSEVPVQESPSIPEMKRKNSRGSDRNAHCKIKVEQVDEPEPKRRIKKSSSAYSSTLLKTGKKPKFVVRAASDVGISGDGYRWRKYGQKMVKGNPHPRNYYRCTSAGCPVRKHTEKAVDSAVGVIITYKGVHDHDMPVPKKRHGPPSGLLVAAAAPASMNDSQSKKIEAIRDQVSTTQWSVDKQGELTGQALDTGGDKPMEPTRTLVSIGFKIKIKIKPS